jgi:type I restriction enzyme S subunit
MVNLNTTLLSKLLFAFPSRAEQLMVVDKIKDFDIMISKEIQISEKLGLLKSGLQNDLLTGRVRVPETIMEGVEKA